MEQLKCSRCNNLKLTSEFSPRPDRPRGYHSFCKECYREYKNKWQAEEYKDPVRRKRRLFRNQLTTERRREKNMQYIIDYLKKHPCVDCGETDPLVLEFDHQGNKEDNISKMLHDIGPLEKIKTEIKKCEVRCANCHRRKTAKDFNYLRLKLLDKGKVEN